MKKIIIISFFITSLFSTAFAQEIGFTLPTSVDQNVKFRTTATNETSTNFISSIFQTYAEISSTDIDFIPWSMTCVLTDLNYWSANNSSGKFDWIITSTHTYTKSINVKLRFKVRILTGSPGSYSQSDKYLEYNVIVKPIPPAVATRYYHLGTNVNYSSYHNILMYDRHGEYVPGSMQIGPNVLDEKYYNSQEAAIKFGITDGGDAYELINKPFVDGFSFG